MLFKKKIFWIVLVLIMLMSIAIVYISIKKNKMEKTINRYIKNNTLIKEVGKKKSNITFNLKNSYYIFYPNMEDKKIDNEIEKIRKELLKDNINKFFNNNKYTFIDYESYISPDNIISFAFKNKIINKSGKLEKTNVYTVNIAVDLKEKLKDTYIFVGDYKSLFRKYIDDYIENNNLISKKVKNYDKILNNKYNYKYTLTKKGVNIYFDSGELLKNNKNDLKIEIPYSYLESVLNIDVSNINKKYKNIKLSKEKFVKTDKVLYVKKTSNLYSNKSKNSKLVSLIYKGTKLKIKKQSQNYSYVEIENLKGYILNDSLSDNIVSDEGFTDKVEKVYTKSDINVLDSPSDKAKTVGTLKFGEEITRIGTNEDGYSEIIYNNEKGFVLTQGVQFNKPTSQSIIGTKNINSSKPMVALTFDDGPNPSSTGRILDTLVKYNAAATFFDLGSLVEKYPQVVKREEEVGCEVGSHTYSHLNLNNLTAAGVVEEINKSKKAFENVLGHDVTLVRPPYGNANEIVKSNIHYPLINWNVDTLDWKSKNKDAIVNEVRKIGNLDGKIVLMHSIYETTADAVEVIVPELLDKGYQLVTVSELAKYKGVSLQSGVKYFGF